MIINANALSIPLADKSVQMICTSPPYWGLRNYGVSGQLGLERTPEEYIANMVAVFRECWRVIRDDGTLWLNCGDSYSGSGKGPEGNLSKGSEFRHLEDIAGRMVPNGLKCKDLVGIPWRLAFALQAEGWYLRSDIIWSKPNPMPESVTDRPTKSHEYLFLMAKQEHYYYDQEAIKEDVTGNTHDRGTKLSPPKESDNTTAGNGHKDWTRYTPDPVTNRNRRTVWTIPTAPYKGAHFATFPPALVEPCIKAGTSERGACPKCGKGWKRITNQDGYIKAGHGGGNGKQAAINNLSYSSSLQPDGMKRNMVTVGWQPACTCDAGDPIPCLVFDPFVGSGTTVKVAYDLGRRGVGLDLSLDYLDEQARKRIHNGHTARLF